jgi:hypothetical protein
MLVCRPSKGAEVARQASSSQRRLIRTTVLFAFSTLVLFGLAPQAEAAKVGYSSYFRTVYYLASPGEVSDLRITSGADSVLLSDANATLTTDKSCKVIDSHNVSCYGKYVKLLYVKTGDLDDRVSLQPLTNAMVDCGLGADTLVTPSPNVKPVDCEQINPPAPPVPVTPPAVTPPAPPLSIVQPVSTMTQRGSVPLTLSCSATAGGSCTGTLVFILPKKAGVHAARRGAPNIIGRQRIIVRRGKKRRVKVSMTGKGRRTVRRNKRLKVTAKLRVTQNGKTTTTTQRVTIKAPRKR